VRYHCTYREENTEILTDASKEVDLEVIEEKTKYMLMSFRYNSGQNHNVKTADMCFKNVAQLKYLGTTVRNQNLIQEDIKRRWNSGNARYQSVLNISSSRMFSKNVNIVIYRIIILHVILYGRET
jgi:hypothetical protein